MPIQPLQKIALWGVRHHVRIFICAAVVFAASMLASSRLRVDSDVLSLLPADAPVIKTFRHTLEEFGGVDTLMILVELPERARGRSLRGVRRGARARARGAAAARVRRLPHRQPRGAGRDPLPAGVPLPRSGRSRELRAQALDPRARAARRRDPPHARDSAVAGREEPDQDRPARPGRGVPRQARGKPRGAARRSLDRVLPLARPPAAADAGQADRARAALPVHRGTGVVGRADDRRRARALGGDRGSRSAAAAQGRARRQLHHHARGRPLHPPRHRGQQRGLDGGRARCSSSTPSAASASSSMRWSRCSWA